jgi:hypothetical protein
MVAERLRRPEDRGRREMTLDDFMRDDPNKPLAVAEYELKRYREQMAKYDSGSQLSYEFFGVRSVDDLRALNTLQATVRYLQARDMRMRIREEIRKSPCTHDSSAVAAAMTGLPFSVQRIIATALANDTVAYLLHTDGTFPSDADVGVSIDPMVLQLRLRDGRWLIVPSLTLLGHTGMAVQFVSCDTTQKRRPPG